MKAIGTHSGAFQADEALGVFLLRQLKRFATVPLVRTRDLEKLKPLEIVIDVGGEYDHEKLRYDHHQRGFSETFGAKWETKLSACGLVYKHYGREVLSALHPQLASSTDQLEWVFEKVQLLPLQHRPRRLHPTASHSIAPRSTGDSFTAYCTEYITARVSTSSL